MRALAPSAWLTSSDVIVLLLPWNQRVRSLSLSQQVQEDVRTKLLQNRCQCSRSGGRPPAQGRADHIFEGQPRSHKRALREQSLACLAGCCGPAALDRAHHQSGRGGHAHICLRDPQPAPSFTQDREAAEKEEENRREKEKLTYRCSCRGRSRKDQPVFHTGDRRSRSGSCT